MAGRIITAKTHRGTCADPECGKPVGPGDRYSRATRYLSLSEVDDPSTPNKISSGLQAIVLHEGCVHPARREGRPTKGDHDYDPATNPGWAAICRDGRVPSAGGSRQTCPRCKGDGCG